MPQPLISEISSKITFLKYIFVLFNQIFQESMSSLHMWGMIQIVIVSSVYIINYQIYF